MTDRQLRDRIRSLESRATSFYVRRVKDGASTEELRQINASCERLNTAAQIIERIIWK